MSSTDAVSLLAVGDLQIMTRQPAADMFETLAPSLRAADIAFGNCEWPYAEEPGDTHPVEAHINDHFDKGDLFLPGAPEAVRMMGEAGFDVMSVANNHTMHGGYRAFARTLSLLREAGIEPVGGGADIEEARRPAVLIRKGCRVAFLGCTSGFLPGAHAGRRTPGIAPLRQHRYAENPSWEQWGIEPDLRTLVNREDLRALCDSIAALRDQADVVVMSCHWGVLEHPWAIAAYQREAARAFIDAGADLIIGHGPLALKGVEVYRGKAVLYSLGKFMMVTPWAEDEVPSGISAPLLGEASTGLAARVMIEARAIRSVAITPVLSNKKGDTALLDPDHPSFAKVLHTLRERTEAAGLNGVVDADGRLAL